MTGEAFSDLPVGVASPALTDKRAKAVLARLERVGATGHHLTAVFRDFLDISEAALLALPAVLAAVETGSPIPVLDGDLCERLQKKYGPVGYGQLQEAFAELLTSTEDGIHDVLGTVYMQGQMGGNIGQFFTPMHIASLMAVMSMGDEVADLKGRLLAAINDSPVATAALLACAVLGGDDGFEFAVHAVAPTVATVDPIIVNDPACGSGVMLLAAAGAVPAWVHRLGLIRFTGSDLDGTCVQMCRINMMIHGLGGSAAAEDSLAA